MTTAAKIVRVLFIENETFWQQKLREELEKQGKNSQFRITSAFFLSSARAIFSGRKDFDVIVVDDCLSDSGRNIDTLDIIQEIRRGFDGHMIACCLNSENGEMLVKAGCDEYVSKNCLSERLLNIT